MAPQASISSIKATPEDLMEMFRHAYTKVTTEWDNVERWINQYDNLIDTTNWPTMSEISIPLFYNAVENALPFALEYLIPDSNFFQLVPRGGSTVSLDTIDRVEQKLAYTLRKKMKLKDEGFLTIKDCYKAGIGYGIVEPKWITPVSEVLVRAYLGAEVVGETVELEPGSPVLSEHYRYLPIGQIIPMPGVRSPQHGDHFFVDFYSEHEFKRIMEADSRQQDGFRTMKNHGDVENIINRTRAGGYDSNITSVQTVIAKLGGMKLRDTNTGDIRVPVMIPVIKCYLQNRHVWLANGEKVIYDEDSKFETMTSPVVMAKAWPDGNRWFTPGIAGHSEDLGNGVNIFNSGMLDIFAHYLNPTRVVNYKSTGGKKPPREPYTDIEIVDDNPNAVSYLNPPVAPPALFEMGGRMQNYFDDTVGQPPNLRGAGSPGIVRGGAGALESMMETPDSRKKLAAVLLELGWLNDTMEKTLFLSQVLVPSAGESFPVRKFVSDGGGRMREVNEMLTVTHDDIRHAYDIEINLRSKLRSSLAEQSARQAEFNLLNNDPFTDQHQLRMDLVQDERRGRRLFFDRERAQQIQSENRIAQLQAEGPPGGAGPAPSTPAEQALAGGASQAIGV